MEGERKHRRYSPSQAERFSACEGSTALITRYVQSGAPLRTSSVYAVEGTNGHEVLETALKSGIRDARVAHENSSLFFEELDDGRNDFYLSVQIAIDHIFSILDEYPDAVMWVERFVNPPVTSVPDEAGGYCDVAIHVPSIRTLFVIDYKHGAGVAKAVKGNRQAMQYGAGFLYEDNALIDPASIDSVVLTIIQPRAFHEDGIIREHDTTPYELWEYLEELDEIITRCERPDAPLTPGEDQCRFCDVRTVCPAREAMALQVANSSFQQINQVAAPSMPVPSSLDIERLSKIRFHAPALRKWLSDVEDHCDELARGGHAIPGAKLVETQARREYYGDKDMVVRKLAAMLGEKDVDTAVSEYENVMKRYPVLDRIYNHKIITITSAEKLVVEEYKRRVGRGRKKKAAEEARQSFAFLTLKKSSGNLVLVDEDDTRPAVNKAQNTFGGITGLLPAPNT